MSSVDADDEEETGYQKNCDFKLPGWADSGEIILFNPSETKDSDKKEIKIDDDNTNDIFSSEIEALLYHI